MPKHVASNGISLKPQLLPGTDLCTLLTTAAQENPHDLRMRRGGNGAHP